MRDIEIRELAERKIRGILLNQLEEKGVDISTLEGVDTWILRGAVQMINHARYGAIKDTNNTKGE